MNDLSALAGTIETIDNLDALLATDLSELAELADIKVPPIGRYTLGISVSTKDDKVPQVLVKYEIISCIEQVNAEDIPAKGGDSFFVTYNIDNKYGLGKLQKDLQVYAEYFNQSNIGDILESMEGVQIEGTVRQREDKKNLDDDGKPRIYGTVVNVEIL
jgi:hypothetical protein